MPYDPRRFGAVVLRGHLRMLEAGLKNSRLSGKQILAKASELTGTTYKRGQYTAALTDLNTLIKEIDNG